MTNFEKWTRQIRPELFLESAGVNTRLTCAECPARGNCMTMQQRTAIRFCGDRFLAWANAEAAE